MKQYLQNRYSDLQKSKIRLAKELATMNPAGQDFREAVAKLQTIEATTNELEYLINNYHPEPEKIVPVAGIQERTDEENEEFHDELIERIVYRGSTEFQSPRTAIKAINQYFVNITSLQWATGQLEFLESLERLSEETEGINEDLIHNMIDSRIGELYSTQSELQHNCNLLEKQLNIN